jgi:hypothetical protein
VLNGALLDVSGPADAGHYLVGTDGRHLFSANSFTLPIQESAIIPSYKILLWRVLADVPWALASEKKRTLVRIAAGDWTLTMKTIDGNYPNWRQVVPNAMQHRTTVKLPEGHEFTRIVNGLPGGELKDSPADLVVDGGSVSVKDTAGGSSIVLAGATTKGPNPAPRLLCVGCCCTAEPKPSAARNSSPCRHHPGLRRGIRSVTGPSFAKWRISWSPVGSLSPRRPTRSATREPDTSGSWPAPSRTARSPTSAGSSEFGIATT